MINSHREACDAEVKVRWELQDTAMVDVEALLIMLYLNRDEPSGTETKGRRKGRRLMWNARMVDCHTQGKSFYICTYKYILKGLLEDLIDCRTESLSPQPFFFFFKISVSSGKCEFEILQNKVTKQQDGTC